MTSVSLICFILLLAGLVLIFKVTPKRVTEEFMKAVKPDKTLRQKVIDARNPKKKKGIFGRIVNIKEFMKSTGEISKFYTAVTRSVCLSLGAVILLIALNNPFLIPIGVIAAGSLPFLLLSRRIKSYEGRMKDELETALSVITTSYLRTDDIVSAVEENIRYIRPPVKDMFKMFITETSLISADVAGCIRNLSLRSDNAVFREWCNVLIRCRQDRSLKDTLPGIVAKLSDERMVNEELKTTLSEIKKEYITMVFMVLGNIPLLYLLNKDWFNSLLFSVPGKITLFICAAVIFVTAIFLGKFTKPLEYGKGDEE